MKWTDELSVGIGSFDKQHQRLIEMLNTFTSNVNKGSNRDKISDIIKHLKEYTLYHFKLEENLMKLHHFPEYESHKKAHDEFVKKVLDYETRFNGGKLLLSVEVSNFIYEWICKHIMTVDSRYSKFLTDRGVH